MLRTDDLHTLGQQLAFIGQPIVILDTEATGGNLFQDRLTEIALVRFDATGITTYQQLLNPDAPISPFIEQLTGISNDMVATAPSFADIADTLQTLLQDAILVAHNSRFDYHFLRLAFKRCGRSMSMPQLCTVKLSRQLYPQHFKHNLDSIIERFDIQLPQRHRAMADVAALTQFLAQAALQRPETWQVSILKLIVPHVFPAWLSPQLRHDIQQLPDDYGVVLVWHTGASQPKVRICEQMYQDVCHKLLAKQAQNWFTSIERIEGIPSIGPIDAAMIASRYQQTDKHSFYTVKFVRDERQQLQAKVQLLQTERSDSPPFGIFAHPKAAKKALLEWARIHGFCPKQLDILPQTLPESSPCPIASGQQCHGACPHLCEQADIEQRLLQKASELPIVGWQSKWATEVCETDGATGQSKRWLLQRSAVQCEDGLWLWDASVFQALKEHLRKGKNQPPKPLVTNALH